MEDYLTGICAAEKSESRKGTSILRREEYRIEMGNLVPSKDFKRFARIAEERLEDIMLHGTEISDNGRS
jgi:muramoyltetrapeptide carboxypeptidase LdcA involved in peptidoglycan recycling